jgi:hypothetical protein
MPTPNCLLAPTARLPLLVCIAAAACLAVRSSFTAKARRDTPCSVAEAVARLGERGLTLHVVAACKTSGAIDSGAFLCERERTWVEVNAL